MKNYKYKKVDAFTAGSSLGNPAACIYLESDQSLPDKEMLEIAKQHKGFVSEVVYCTRNRDSSFELIYFSSECEVPFCGHGTIACMYSIIKETPELIIKPKIKIHTRQKGVLTIYNKLLQQDAVFISAPTPIYLDVNLKTKEIADNLQTDISTISDDYPIEFIDAGNRTLIIPIKQFSDEVSIFPNEQMLKDFSINNDIDVILIFCMNTENKTSIAHTRVFAPKYGYLEDPATGSANSAFGYYMLKNNMWNGEDITIEQGGNDRIFNTVHLSYSENKLLFGGSATTRIDGYYLL